ncbi:diacylglycerol kinase family protein [Nocardiopsis sp. MG754419]|uniref:diacylglycerol/lipid kinase family protein n=1 Tax=Nocardiopsis sp. MG754419 TaxID=2259865 RepID=UPI001BA5779C|nr:diacylglycerol kinase family protein [Nocardiopsis sp. MG754419]MBR8743784.1 diacylglycerol kinase family lipid kinase [Nocardiopsis sp. MG754419]
MRALFIMNPKATTTTDRTGEVILDALRSELDVTVIETAYRDHARELARDAAEDGYELVLSLGGDGTVNEVVNGLLATPESKNRPSYAVIPGGSANVFIRALGVSGDPVEATGQILAAIRAGREREVNLGRITSDQDDRYFTFCAGFGWDADVVQHVEHERENGRKATPALYAEVAVKLFFGGDIRDPSLTVSTGGRSLEEVYFALVTNTTPWTYAGALPLQPTPSSRFELGLDAFALTRSSYWLTGWVLSQMFLPKGLPTRGDGYVTWHDQGSLQITSAHPRAFQIDGEYLGEREQVNFHSVPKALRIFC